jgi:membrane protease YdiL (CAAX protease family)
MVGLLALSGFYQVESTDSPTILLHAFRRFGIGAFIQELAFRLILFKILEDWLGSWTAMGLIALIFAALHLGNQNATIPTSVALAFEDLLLTAAFMLTRRLWFVWGIHFGWNFLQDGVFGMPNSGETVFPSWITSSVTGPEWLTGGAFGIEASVVAVILCLLVAAPILKAAIRRGKAVTPLWKRTEPLPT